MLSSFVLEIRKFLAISAADFNSPVGAGINSNSIHVNFCWYIQRLFCFIAFWFHYRSQGRREPRVGLRTAQILYISGFVQSKTGKKNGTLFPDFQVISKKEKKDLRRFISMEPGVIFPPAGGPDRVALGWVYDCLCLVSNSKTLWCASKCRRQCFCNYINAVCFRQFGRDKITFHVPIPRV